MSYILSSGDNWDPLGPPKFESFWLWQNFNVDAATGVVQVTKMYFAVYFSDTSQNVGFTRPEPAVSQYRIADSKQPKCSFDLLHSGRIDSTSVEFSNESGQLHLFQFKNQPAEKIHPPTWMNAGAWAPTYANPTQNQNPINPFLSHKVTFGKLTDRHVDAILSREDNKGTNSLLAAIPFASNSIFSQILLQDNLLMPALHFERQPPGVGGPKWSYFAGSPLPGNVDGYAMVAKGAFQAMPFNWGLRKWNDLKDPGFNPADIMDRLWSVIHGSTEFRRTLHSASDTLRDSVFKVNADIPVELLYLENLNAGQAVPRMV